MSRGDFFAFTDEPSSKEGRAGTPRLPKGERLPAAERADGSKGKPGAPLRYGEKRKVFRLFLPLSTIAGIDRLYELGATSEKKKMRADFLVDVVRAEVERRLAELESSEGEIDV